jgi:FkbM family methyltransferase
MMADGDCARCGHRYLQDLPSGHGLLYPATLDLDSGETFQAGDGTWFAAALRGAWEEPDTGPVALTIDGRAEPGPALLLNCLDKVYGHALLKLLNVQSHVEADERRVIVLIPASLRELVPAGTAEVWTVDEPTARFSGWLVDLETRLAAELDRFDDCVLSPAYPHPHPSRYSLDQLVRHVPAERDGDPSIVLSLRADRSWGANATAQQRNVARLWERLASAFPEAGCAAVGAAAAGGLPQGVTDLTRSAPDREIERRWLALMRGADLALGVHGSNMLLPSGLARASVELVPAERYGNVLQATLPSSLDPVTTLIRHRTLYGADDLSDISPDRVAEVAISVLRERERMERVLAGPGAGIGDSAALGAVPLVRDPQPASRPSLTDLRPGRAFRRVSAAARNRARVRRLHDRVQHADLPEIVHDERGLAFDLETRDELERFLVDDGHVEGAELALLSAYLEEGMTAVDVGANVGVFTATLAHHVGLQGAVHSFEPLPSTRRRLERTVELNGLAQVVVNDCAVADRDGELELHEYGPGYESWATLAPREIETADGTLRTAHRLTVNVVTLDHYCAERGIERVDVLKVDVEGAEERVLVGASGLLAAGAVDLIMVEVADTTLSAAGSQAHALLDRLETHALDGTRLRPFRIAGPHLAMTNVIAASAHARDRLRRLGLLSRV